MIKYAWENLKCFKKEMLKFGLLYCLSAHLSVLLPYINGKYLDEIISHISLYNILYLTIAIMVMSVTNITVSYFIRITGLSIESRISYSIRQKTDGHLLKIPYIKFRNYEIGYLNNRINTDINVIVNFWLKEFPNFILNIFIIASIMIMIIKIDIVIFIISAIVILVYILIYLKLSKKYYLYNYVLKEKGNIYNSSLLEQFNNYYNIKIKAMFSESSLNINNKFIEYLKEIMTTGRFVQLYKSLDNIINMLFMIIVILIAAIKIWNGNMTIGQFTILNSYFSILMKCFKFYISFGMSYQELQVSYNRIRELENLKQEDNGINKLEKICTITVKNFNYYYNNTKNIFRDFNLKLIRNNLYGIKGKNGLGKSTLINLLIGVLQWDGEGDIYYNNINIKKLDLYYLRKNLISVMPQERIVINYSIEQFIELDDINNRNNIISLIKKYNLSDLYHDINGLNIFQMLDRKVSSLSGGEQQKIVFLKVISSNSDLIILDEPFSAMDSISTKKLLNCIKMLKNDKIIILVSHDEDVLDECDEVIAF